MDTKQILSSYRNIAIVGLSKNPEKQSYVVAEYLKNSLEIVNIFRPPEEVESIVKQSIRLREKYGKPYVIWMQLEKRKKLE